MSGKRVWVKTVIIVLQLLFYTDNIVADNITEYFDTDPGWTASGLPVNDNDFGFRQSSIAGGEPGEAGGFFSATDQLVWYGDDDIGNITGEQIISASGIMSIISVDAHLNNNIFIGHFNDEDSGSSGCIGFQILEEPSGNQKINPASFRIFFKVCGGDPYGVGSPTEGLLFVISNLGESRNWSYHYDPEEGDYGALTVSIS